MIAIKDMKMPKTKKVPRLYQTWINMRRRCRESDRKYYFQRGIKVCDEWGNYKNFKKWAYNNGYNDLLTIDRINTNDDYKPSNCRWVTIKEQQRNKRSNIRICFNGENHCISEWAEIIGISTTTLCKRLNKGWPIERALTENLHKKIFHNKGKLLFNINGKILSTKEIGKLLGRTRGCISGLVRKLGYEEALSKIKDKLALIEVEVK